MKNKIIKSFLDLLMPRICPVCNRSLNTDEDYLCVKCLYDLPRTNMHRVEFNRMEQLFAGKILIERATGYFYYEKDSPYSGIIKNIKYYNQPLMARWMAKNFATEIIGDGFFNDIDFITPVPLYKSKMYKRGYNQSSYIAAGISEATAIPVKEVLMAKRPHESQTRKGIYDRWINTQDIYHKIPDTGLKGKHILIVDDVITTGATLLACANAIKQDDTVRISALSLAVGRQV